jgi:ribosomal protein L37E
MAKRICISCGMPMTKPADHALGDSSKEWCAHCAHPDGTMKSYEEALESMSRFMVEAKGMKPASARVAVREMMSKLPAWKGRG